MEHTVFSNHSLKVENIGSIPASRSKPFEGPLIFNPASFLTPKEPQAAIISEVITGSFWGTASISIKMIRTYKSLESRSRKMEECDMQ